MAIIALTTLPAGLAVSAATAAGLPLSRSGGPASRPPAAWTPISAGQPG